MSLLNDTGFQSDWITVECNYSGHLVQHIFQKFLV